MIDIGNDDGFVEVVAGGASVALDLWDVNSRVYEFHQKNKDRPDSEYGRGLVELFEGLGLPGLSHRAASRLLARLNEAVAELKKKDSPNAESPASTASTPAA